jgi:hypothetical protein
MASSIERDQRWCHRMAALFSPPDPKRDSSLRSYLQQRGGHRGASQHHPGSYGDSEHYDDDFDDEDGVGAAASTQAAGNASPRKPGLQEQQQQQLLEEEAPAEEYLPQCFLLHFLAQNHRSVSQMATPRGGPEELRGRHIVAARDERFWANRIATAARQGTAALHAAETRRYLKSMAMDGEIKALECTRELQEMLAYVQGQNRMLEDAAKQLQVSRALSRGLAQ